MAKWPSHFFLANYFKKGQMATLFLTSDPPVKEIQSLFPSVFIKCKSQFLAAYPINQFEKKPNSALFQLSLKI